MRTLLLIIVAGALLLQLRLKSEIDSEREFTTFILDQFQACAEDAYKARGAEEGPY